MARQATLELVGDASKVISALKKAEGATDSFGDKVKGAGTKMTAFATVPIVGFLGLAAKAAIDDAAAQDHLAKTLENTVGASRATVTQVESYIEAAMRASTFTDDELRPSFEALVTASGDVEKANELMAVAMDVAAGKGIPLETATLAVAKASEGQFAAVNKLVPGLLDLSDKTLTAETATKKLSDLFAGHAQASTETAAGKAKNMSRDMGELSEKIGAQLLPAVTKLVDFFAVSLLPTLDKLSGGNGAFVLLGVAAAGPVLTNIVKLRDAIVGLNLSLDATAVKAAAALGAVGLLYFGSKDLIADINKGLKENASLLDKSKSLINSILGGGGEKGIFGKRFLGLEFATGGTVPGPIGAPQMAVVHGGETITPYGRGGSGGGAGVVVNVTVPGLVGSEDQLARTIQSLLLQLQSRTGGLGFEAA
jgi:hypothetical protein